MIGYIKGKITDRFDGGIIVENNGIGYEVHVPDSSHLYLKQGREAQETVYTTMIVREDDVSLYGFTDKQSIFMFKKLLSVSGVGAKAALSMLSMLSPDEISKAILFDDVATITRAQGIGKKIAQRIVLELRDKISDLSGFPSGQGIGGIASTQDGKTEALHALVALGYSKSEAAEVLQRVEGENLSSEEYIKLALKSL